MCVSTCTIADKNQINSLAFHRYAGERMPFHAPLRCARILTVIVQR